MARRETKDIRLAKIRIRTYNLPKNGIPILITSADIKIIATESQCMNAVRERRHIVLMDDFRYALDKLLVEAESEPHGMFV